MIKDYLYKCDNNMNPIYSNKAVIEKIETQHPYTYFQGTEIPNLNLSRGDYVFLNMGDMENKIKVFKVELMVSNDMIQCSIPPTP